MMQGNSFTVYVWLQYSKYTAMSQFISSEIAAFTYSIISGYGKDRKPLYAITLTIKKQSAGLARIKIDTERRKSPEGEKYEWISNCFDRYHFTRCCRCSCCQRNKAGRYTVCDLLKRCCGIFGKDGTWCHGCTELSEEIFTVKKEA